MLLTQPERLVPLLYNGGKTHERIPMPTGPNPGHGVPARARPPARALLDCGHARPVRRPRARAHRLAPCRGRPTAGRPASAAGAGRSRGPGAAAPAGSALGPDARARSAGFADLVGSTRLREDNPGPAAGPGGPRAPDGALGRDGGRGRPPEKLRGG